MIDEKLWVLFISWETSESCEIFEEEEDARASLFGWVKETWVDEGFDEDEMHDDPKEAIEFYYQNVENGWYYLQPVTVFRRAK
jgi:hypothetical protein